jgi:hypothetical protein
MSTAEWATVGVAVAGIIGTVAAASVQSWLANQRHSAQLAHDRAMADRGDLRALLDTAAEVAREAVWANAKVVTLARSGDADGIRWAGDVTIRLTRQCVLMSGRLALRVGREHVVYQRFELMVAVFEGMQRELLAATPSGPRADLGLVRRGSIAARFDEIANRWESEFTDAWREFIDAAGGLAGATLVEDAPRARPLARSRRVGRG